jgi:hypothetical protein
MSGIRSIIFLGLLLLTAGVAHAQAVFVIGVGQWSCGKLIAATATAPPGSSGTVITATGTFVDEHAMYQEWLMGFVTGYNFARASEQQKQIMGIDQAGTDLWMRNWCNQHPTKLLMAGAIAFIKEMQGARDLPDAAAGQR